MSSRQDRQGARTASDLEQKYNFKKSFAEIMGVALDAQKSVEETNALMEAELSLKLGRNEYDEIVSMLNASANIITLNSNRLVIKSDKFSLSQDGTVSMRFSEDDAEDDYLLNTETHYLKLPDFEVMKTKSDGSYTKMKSARIGTALFGTDDIKVTRQIEFADDGIIIPSKANLINSRSCFVWENSDGTHVFRMRGYDNGLWVEGVNTEDGNLDLNAFGISLRSILNRLEAVEAKLDDYPSEPDEPDDPCANGHSYGGGSYEIEGSCSVCGASCPHDNVETNDEGYTVCVDCGYWSV